MQGAHVQAAPSGQVSGRRLHIYKLLQAQRRRVRDDAAQPELPCMHTGEVQIFSSEPSAPLFIYLNGPFPGAVMIASISFIT